MQIYFLNSVNVSISTAKYHSLHKRTVLNRNSDASPYKGQNREVSILAKKETQTSTNRSNGPIAHMESRTRTRSKLLRHSVSTRTFSL